MKKFQISSTTEVKEITLTKEEEAAYLKAMKHFDKDMEQIRAESNYKSNQSHLLAAKIILD